MAVIVRFLAGLFALVALTGAMPALAQSGGGRSYDVHFALVLKACGAGGCGEFDEATDPIRVYVGRNGRAFDYQRANGGEIIQLGTWIRDSNGEVRLRVEGPGLAVDYRDAVLTATIGIRPKGKGCTMSVRIKPADPTIRITEQRVRTMRCRITPGNAFAS